MKFDIPILNSLKDSSEKSQFYTLSKSQRRALEYDTFCMRPPKDIFIMRQFEDAGMSDLLDRQLTTEQRFYRDHGYIILKNFIPEEIIDRYLELRASLDMGLNSFDWDDTPNRVKTPHVVHQAIRDISCYAPLTKLINHLHSMEMGLIFALTSYRSTERGWHQDSYLDADDAVPRCASWIAVGDIREDSGPFEYIPKSNRWPALSNQKINQYLHNDYHWPAAHRHSIKKAPRWGKLCEDFLDPAIDRKIADEKHEVNRFVASKGDVLIWYGRLMHRGTQPASSEIARPALINHYAPIGEKGRGLFAKRHDGGYFLVPPAVFGDLKDQSDIF